MRNRFVSLIKHIVSGLSAAAMMFSNAAPIVTFADDTIQYAHTINLFEIKLTGGADYSAAFKDDNAKDNTPEIDGYVWSAPNSNSGHKFIYTVDFSLSGQGISDNDTELIKEGFVEIHIPAHILRLKGQDKAGGSGDEKKYGDAIELSVPKASDVAKVPVYDDSGKPVTDNEDNIIYTYDTDYDFIYKEGTDENGDPEIIIYNIKPISAGQVYEFPMAYKTLYSTWDYEDLAQSDGAKAKVIVDSWKKSSTPNASSASDNKDEITAKTREVPVYINTGVTIDKVSKTVRQPGQTELMTASQLEKADFIQGKGLNLDANKDDYLYMVWQVNSKVTTVTQKYSYTLTDTPGELSGYDAEGDPHSVQGEFVAMNISNGDFQKPAADGNGNYSITAEDLTGDPPQVLVITRYLKSKTDEINNAPRNGYYRAINDAEGKVTPADEKDKVTKKPSQAEFIYNRKKPSIAPIIEDYKSSKKGVTTSYELNNIIEDNKPVTNLKYNTTSKMYSYGNTIEDLNKKLTKSIIAKVSGNDITISSPLGDYTAQIGKTGYKKGDEEISTDQEMTSDELLRIVASELAETFYGKEDVTYSFTDRKITLIQPDNSSNTLLLTPDDYSFSSVEFSFTADNVEFDPEALTFNGNTIVNPAKYDPDATIDLYTYIGSSDTPVLAAKYHPDTKTYTDLDTNIVSSATSVMIRFKNDARVSGYKLTTSNKYFCVQLNTKPSVTINPTASVKEFLKSYGTEGDLKQVNVQNNGTYDVKAHDDTPLYSSSVYGTDTVSQDKRTSSITKEARSENDDPIIGKDGESYRTINDTLHRQYIVTWKTKIQELYSGSINGVAVNNVPVEQQSGVFYDLLPLHSDVIEGSVNVFVDGNNEPLPASSFKVYPREDDFNGSGQKMMKVEIYAPCNSSYTMSYATVHSHADIQDYGSMTNNTIAYQTGNENIGGGYPDNGGNHALSKSAYMIGLDPDNGDAKRFIYAEATENIVALIQTSSGIFKYVSSESDPTQKQTTVVHPGEDYTYHYRMKNSLSTQARDIAILDSVENYRTVEGVRYNFGIAKNREWNGTIKSFNLANIENRMRQDKYSGDVHLFVYTGSEIVDFESINYSDAVERQHLLKSILGELKPGDAGYVQPTGWKEVNWRNPGDLKDVSAFIVYTGEGYTLPKGASMNFTVTMTAPPTLQDDRDPKNGEYLTPFKTYNNVYRSFTNIPLDPETDKPKEGQYYYTHFDYTETAFKVTGNLEFTKNDSDTNQKIEGVTFSLTGISDYGSTYYETLTSDRFGKVLFEDLEKGTYTLTETVSDDDHILDTEPKKVTVLPNGEVTIVKINGTELDMENGIYKITNKPRPHTDIVFSKLDSVTDKNVNGAKFTLRGTSDLNTVVDMTAFSTNGTVTFSSVEPGTYTLTEEYPADGYAAPVTNTYTVTVTQTGDYSASYKIEGMQDNTVYNDPLASTKLIKADSISKNPLEGAEFTVTAPTELNNSYAALKQAYEKKEQSADFKWSFDGTSWKQTAESGSIKGEYALAQLIPGSGYTLSETTAPRGYAAIGDISFSVKDGSVVFGDSDPIEYLVLNTSTHEYDPASPEQAEYIRVNDEPTFEDTKLIDKSWVGEITVDESAPKFPTVHLKNEKPAESVKVVTIDDGLKALIQGNKTNFTGLERSSTKPDNADACKADVDGEDGEFYAWWDPTDKKVKWWSDANIIYLPIDCESLFSGLNNNEIEIDLSAFDFSKVTTMKAMFASVQGNDVYGKYDSKNTKIKTITFPSNIDTSKVTNMDGMFYGCNMLTTLDLTGFNTANVSSMQAMFKNCSKLEEIKLDPTKFIDDSLTNVFRMFDNCNALKGIDLRGFKGEKLSNAQSWFARCYKLDYIDLSNFNGGSQITIIKYTFEYAGKDATKGCAIFSNKWMLNDISTSNPNNAENVVNTSKFNLYGTKYTPDGFNKANFDIATPAEGGGTTSLSGANANRYFNDPNGDYYTEFFDEAYRNKIITVTQPTTSPTAITFGNYTNFEKCGSVTQVKNTTATADDVGKTEFVYEYITGETGTLVEEGKYTVPQKINLTIRVPLDDTHVTEYYYTKETTATWTKVSNGDSPDWQLEMNVNNSDEEFYLWEDKFDTYKADTSENNPKVTKGDDGKALLVNTATDQQTGSLKLKKTMKDDLVLDPEQTFIFNVVMKKSDNSPYTKAPFDSEGNATFKLKADEEILLSGLPVGAQYTVSEMIEDTELYEKVTADDPSGTIIKDFTSEAVIENSFKTRDLTLSKTSRLYENDGSATLKTLELSEDTEWQNAEFTFTVNFSGLVPEYPYSWLPSGKAVDKNGNISFEVKLKQGESSHFTDLPASAAYTISEETLTNTSLAEFTQQNDADAESGVTTGHQTVKGKNSVTFTNTKTLLHDKYVITVKKTWLDENGHEMPIAADGTIMKADRSAAESTIPSFLNTYLGRALRYEADGKTYYMSVEPKFMTVKLNKANKWQQEIRNLEKTKTVSTGDTNTAIYDYVYFLWEDCPIAYESLTTGTVTEKINLDEYKFYREETVAKTAYTYSLKNQKMPTYSLLVDKTVTGNLGNKTKDFSFVIRFNSADGSPLTGTGLRATFNGTRNRTITLNNDGTFPFTLSHNEKILFEGLPKDTTYTLVEKQADDYATTITRKVGGTAQDPVDGKEISGTLISNQEISYKNDRSGTLPMGIDLGSAATAAAALAAVTGIGFLKLRRRKETE